MHIKQPRITIGSRDLPTTGSGEQSHLQDHWNLHIFTSLVVVNVDHTVVVHSRYGAALLAPL